MQNGKKGKDDDSDDPIAQAMAIRIKAGGPTQVISAADAKKMGLKVTAPPVSKPADKGKPIGAKEEKKVPVAKDKENQDTENKKLPGDKAKITPGIAKARPSISQPGKKGEAEEDPIEKSLAERIKAGGVT